MNISARESEDKFASVFKFPTPGSPALADPKLVNSKVAAAGETARYPEYVPV